MALSRTAALLSIVTLALLSAPAAATAAARPGGHPAPRLQATVALAPRDPGALAHYAQEVTDPGSAAYHRYLSVAQFRARFGASPAAVARVRRALSARGLRAGKLAANGLELAVASSAPEQAFATGAGRTATASPSTTTLAAVAGGSLVQGVVGSGAPGPTSQGVVRPLHSRPAAHARGTASASGTPSAHDIVGAAGQPCSDASAAATDSGAYTADQIANAYGMTPAGDGDGSGVTVALYELEPFSSADLAADESCYGASNPVSTVMVDGGAGTGPGSGEAAMDLATLIGLAPAASIVVYEAPDSGLGAYDAYSRIITSDSAQVVSTSWGQCEALEGRGAAAAEQTLFEEAALQGQSVIAAAGDSGSDDCGNGTASVDDPASQPWVTGVGATSLTAGADSVWNNAYGASGGGVSKLWGRPSYQDALPPAPGACGSAAGCREVPDLSIDGDPATGYVASYDGAWQMVGGSSVAAPAIAAVTALAESSPACAGRRVGFLNPILYGRASSDLRDVTVGDNSFAGVSGSTAGVGYDTASGLGVPSTGLGSALCASAGTGTAAAEAATLKVRTLANRVDRVGQHVHMRVAVHRPAGTSIAFSATGLPLGLTLDRETGVIAGRPLASGSHIVHLSVTEGSSGAAQASFHWTIDGPSPVTSAERHDGPRRHRGARR